jgi:hypothetical protein
MGVKWEVVLTKTICSFEAAWIFSILICTHYSAFLAKYCNFESNFFAVVTISFRKRIEK